MTELKGYQETVITNNDSNPLYVYHKDGKTAPELLYTKDSDTDSESGLERVIKYLIENNLIKYYTGKEDFVKEHPDDFIKVNDGIYIPSDMITRLIE